MPQTARMFIAAHLAPEIVEELRQTAARLCRSARGRYSSAENYHVTLAFLGETDRRLASEIGAVLQKAVHGAAPIPYGLGGLGFFGKPQGAVLWCGISGALPLARLGNDIRARLEGMGISYDRKPLRAHVTLARNADVRPLRLEEYAPAPLQSKIRALSLFESTRIDGVLTYIPLVTARF